MKLKICGMKYQDNIAAVANLQPDYLGFIFHEDSPRHFKLNTSPQLPKQIKKVGVFVNKPIDYIIDKIEEHQLSAVQLHGHESPDFCKKLMKHCHSEFISESHDEIQKQHFGKLSVSINHDKKIEIIKVFSIKDKFDFSVLQSYEDVCDYFLFDTKGKHPGGNGYMFDWNVLNDYPSTKPFFLSGGIGLNEIDNISAFKKNTASKYCYAIDVNSKFEIEPGLKNINELSKLINQLLY